MADRIPCDFPECSSTFRDRSEKYGHLRNCPYREVRCPQCQNIYPANQISWHITKKCLLRPTSCGNCAEMMAFWELSQHQESCPKLPVKCDGCGKEFSRDEIDSHPEKCDGKLKVCSVKDPECGFNNRKTLPELTEHESHFKWICRLVGSLLDEASILEEKSQAYKEANDRLISENHRLEEEANLRAKNINDGVKKLNENIFDIDKKNDQLTLDDDKLMKEIIKLEDQLIKSTENIKDFNDEAERMKEKIMKIDEINVQFRSENDRLKEKVINLKKQLAEALASDDLNNDVLYMRKRILKAEAVNDELSVQVGQLKEDKMHLEEKVRKLSECIHNLNERLMEGNEYNDFEGYKSDLFEGLQLQLYFDEKDKSGYTSSHSIEVQPYNSKEKSYQSLQLSALQIAGVQMTGMQLACSAHKTLQISGIQPGGFQPAGLKISEIAQIRNAGENQTKFDELSTAKIPLKIELCTNLIITNKSLEEIKSIISVQAFDSNEIACNEMMVLETGMLFCDNASGVVVKRCLNGISYNMRLSQGDTTSDLGRFVNFTIEKPTAGDNWGVDNPARDWPVSDRALLCLSDPDNGHKVISHQTLCARMEEGAKASFDYFFLCQKDIKFLESRTSLRKLKTAFLMYKHPSKY